MRNLNHFNSSLKFTSESIETDISFLDLKVKLCKGQISTDLYVKPTDRHQYLHYTSSHPNHTKRSIVYSQGLRVKRICSEENIASEHLQNMSSWFQKRGYPQHIVETELKKVYGSSNKNSNESKGVPLVVTYHLLIKDLSKIISKNLHLLYIDEEVKKVFTPKPMVSYRSARKLSSYLVRAKIYPLERSVSSFQC